MSTVELKKAIRKVEKKVGDYQTRINVMTETLEKAGEDLNEEDG